MNKHCENCNEPMVESTYNEVNPSTSGFVTTADELFEGFGNICFKCARDLKLYNWIREGATKDETYNFNS